MEVKSDIEIAQARAIRPIRNITVVVGVDEEYLEYYGKYKVRIDLKPSDDRTDRSDGKLILVTTTNPTPVGEDKITTTVSLADGMRHLGKNTVVTLREPPLGPVFGVKEGAAGGGCAQVIPMEDINLHFTGDFHAIGAANNLLAAMLDNHAQQGNTLDIDVRRITWKYCVDMNDRQLRNTACGPGGKVNGVPREDGFDIIAVSEIMAILCLADSLIDLRVRLGRMVVVYNRSGTPVTAYNLKAEGATATLLRGVIRPNLVQTLESTPVFIRGGPSASIAYDCNSVMATRVAPKMGNYVTAEAGFGADLGAEKFLDIKCRLARLHPDVMVAVVTARALKHHGGCPKAELGSENLAILGVGLPNLLQYTTNIIEVYGLSCVVAANRFPADTKAEPELVENRCRALGVSVALSEVWAEDGEDGVALAEEATRLCDAPDHFTFSYELDASIEDKLAATITKVYHGGGVVLTPTAQKQAVELTELDFGSLPIYMAKTQYSFSDNVALLGAPRGFTIAVCNIKAPVDAGFLVALAGGIMTIPDLSKVPVAEKMDVDENGRISGLF